MYIMGVLIHPFILCGVSMKIIALSDNHGLLPKLNAIGDVLVMAGDWSPLSIQWSYLDMITWIDDKFIPWMLGVNVSHIVFIPGNHDLVCTSKSFTRDFNKLLKKHHTNKIHFLNRSSIIIDGIKFLAIYNDNKFFLQTSNRNNLILSNVSVINLILVSFLYNIPFLFFKLMLFS